MKKIEAIRKYFDKCPLLDEEARINIDYIGNEVVEYAIYSEPINPIYKEYVDGGKIKQFGFTFTTINYYSAEILQQLENSNFFEDFQKWIEDNNKNYILPQVKGAIKIEILTNGFLLDAEADKAKYQIQLKLIYKED